MRRNVPVWLTTLATALVPAAVSRADFVVTVGSATVAQGGTGTVDVLIRSTNPAGDPLSSFGFDFQILSAGAAHLDFQNPQHDAQLAQAGYVFAGNSGDAVDKVAVGAVHSVAGGVNNQFVGGDETDSGGNVSVQGNVLLVRLDLTALTSSAPLAGDRFTVALVADAFTGFRDANNAPIPFTSTLGVVTIGAAVPEPSALVTTLIGGALILGLVARRRRRVR
jgi:hypothetical protein